MITAIWIASVFGAFLLGAMIMGLMAAAKRGDSTLDAVELSEFQRMLNGARQQ